MSFFFLIYETSANNYKSFLTRESQCRISHKNEGRFQWASIGVETASMGRVPLRLLTKTLSRFSDFCVKAFDNINLLRTACLSLSKRFFRKHEIQIIIKFAISNTFPKRWVPSCSKVDRFPTIPFHAVKKVNSRVAQCRLVAMVAVWHFTANRTILHMAASFHAIVERRSIQVYGDAILQLARIRDCQKSAQIAVDPFSLFDSSRQRKNPLMEMMKDGFVLENANGAWLCIDKWMNNYRTQFIRTILTISIWVMRPHITKLATRASLALEYCILVPNLIIWPNEACIVDI